MVKQYKGISADRLPLTSQLGDSREGYSLYSCSKKQQSGPYSKNFGCFNISGSYLKSWDKGWPLFYDSEYYQDWDGFPGGICWKYLKAEVWQPDTRV